MDDQAADKGQDAEKKDGDKDGEQDDEENKEDQDLLEDREDRKVDTDKIKAVTTIVDEFNNIVSKNFSVYG